MPRDRVCKIDGCAKPHYGRGYCQTHYARLRRNGDANSVRKLANGTVLRWIEAVALSWESDECLSFPFALGNHGYGLADGDLAHRIVCERVNGPAPIGMQAAHSCGHRTCVNKRHLRWATRQSNEADKLLHGTRARGEEHVKAKLTKADVLAIRGADGSQRAVAAQFNIAQQTVSDIRSGRRWSWL